MKNTGNIAEEIKRNMYLKKESQYELGGMAEGILHFVKEYKKTSDFKNELEKAKLEKVKELKNLVIKMNRENSDFVTKEEVNSFFSILDKIQAR